MNFLTNTNVNYLMHMGYGILAVLTLTQKLRKKNHFTAYKNLRLQKQNNIKTRTHKKSTFSRQRKIHIFFCFK